MTGLLGSAIAGVLLAGLVAIGVLPTGSPDPAGVAPSGSRVAASTAVDRDRVLLVSTDGRLQVVVAYHGRKGWLGALAGQTPAGTTAAWTATTGRGPVPALSAVYGGGAAGTATTVLVQWVDGRTSRAVVGPDGSWLVVRPGRVASARVRLVDHDGRAVTTVAGP